MWKRLVCILVLIAVVALVVFPSYHAASSKEERARFCRILVKGEGNFTWLLGGFKVRDFALVLLSSIELRNGSLHVLSPGREILVEGKCKLRMVGFVGIFRWEESDDHISIEVQGFSIASCVIKN